MFPKLTLTEDQIRGHYAKTTAQAVEASLACAAPGYLDLLNLLSPAAAAFLPQMRASATLLRRRYYGRTVSIYAPLYISNSCVNSCLYCDFNIRHQAPRKILTPDEIMIEAEAIRATGIDSLLIVAGEDPRATTVEFLCEAGRRLKQRFSFLALEVAPQSEEAYAKLFEAGYEGVVCFQETYNRDLYRHLHPAGPKSDYDWRLWTQLRAGKAGMRTLGAAFLLGLDDWRIEAASLGAHALYLLRECYRAKIQFAFPRITPVSGGFQPARPVEEAELEQMMLAFRIAFPQCGMTVSTRESPAFRDAIVQTCADNMSAGSRVTPGGYAILAGEDVGQFTLNDPRTVAAVETAIRSHGQEVVRKYWDNRI